jgi:hypothetical protein
MNQQTPPPEPKKDGQSQPGGDSPPPPPEPKKDEAPSLYKQMGMDDPPANTTWSDKWREEFATGEDGKPNEAALKTLARFQNPKDLFKSWTAAQERIRSGEYKRVSQPPDPSNAEAMTQWRQENNIPATADEYDLIPEGIKPEEIDGKTKESLQFIQKGLHEANIPATAAKALSKIMVDMAAQQQEALTEADAGNMDNCEDALMTDWGADYKTNLKANMATMKKHWGEDMEDIISARTPSGRRLADIPAFNKAINALARSEGADILYDGENRGGSSLESRRAEIEKIMAEDMSKYNSTKGLPEEYTAILQKLEQRGKL